MGYRFSELRLRLQVIMLLFGFIVPYNVIANSNVRVHMWLSLTAAGPVEAGSDWSQREDFRKQDYTVIKMF